VPYHSRPIVHHESCCAIEKILFFVSCVCVSMCECVYMHLYIFEPLLLKPQFMFMCLCCSCFCCFERLRSSSTTLFRCLNPYLCACVVHAFVTLKVQGVLLEGVQNFQCFFVRSCYFLKYALKRLGLFLDFCLSWNLVLSFKVRIHDIFGIATRCKFRFVLLMGFRFGVYW